IAFGAGLPARGETAMGLFLSFEVGAVSRAAPIPLELLVTVRKVPLDLDAEIVGVIEHHLILHRFPLDRMQSGRPVAARAAIRSPMGRTTRDGRTSAAWHARVPRFCERVPC